MVNIAHISFVHFKLSTGTQFWSQISIFISDQRKHENKEEYYFNGRKRRKNFDPFNVDEDNPFEVDVSFLNLFLYHKKKVELIFTLKIDLFERLNS